MFWQFGSRFVTRGELTAGPTERADKARACDKGNVDLILERMLFSQQSFGISQSEHCD